MVLPVLLLLAGLSAGQQEAQPQAPPAAVAQPADPAQLQATIDKGLSAFARRRFKAAETAFREAVAAEPTSAAATFYLAYTLYKIAEPTRRLTPEKEEAADLFARAFTLDPRFRPVWGRKRS